MVSEGTPPIVTTVLAADGRSIHLTTSDAATTPSLTLCRQPVLGRARARAYHRWGCVTCATEALSRGVTAVPDLNHAILNLPRFVAARVRLSRTVPEQRTPLSE